MSGHDKSMSSSEGLVKNVEVWQELQNTTLAASMSDKLSDRHSKKGSLASRTMEYILSTTCMSIVYNIHYQCN
jgi:hypothetical protein